MRLSEIVGAKPVGSVMVVPEVGTYDLFEQVSGAWPRNGFTYTKNELITAAEVICERVAKSGAHYLLVAEDQTPWFWFILERVAATYNMLLLVKGKSSNSRGPEFYTGSPVHLLERELTLGVHSLAFGEAA